MFKRAKVLHVFDKKISKKLSYDSLNEILNHYNLNVSIFPSYNETAKMRLFNNMIPNTLFCITQNTGRSNSYAFICSPASSLNMSFPVKPGEEVWYFEDETFNVNDIEKYPISRFYWTSRISGSFSTEDLFHTSSSGAVKELFDNELNQNIPQNSGISYYLEKYDNISNDKHERYFADIDEVVIQGEKGNFLRLGRASNKNKSGVIDIVAGKNYYGSEEYIKSLAFEGQTSLENDASRILVSNLGYFDIGTGENQLYNDSLTKSMIVKNKFELSAQNSFSFNTKKNNISAYNEKENFFNATMQLNLEENIRNFSLLKINDESPKPNVSIKSSIINIISKNEGNKDEDHDHGIETYPGEIRLIRESSFINKSSQVLLNKENDIILDGETLYLGNFNRLLVEKNIVTQEEVSLNPESVIDNLSEDQLNSLKDLYGKGENILIGYEKSLSEPLVLGNTLMVLLKDMIDLTQLTIDQNRILNDKVNSLAQEYSTHTHTVNAVPNSIPVIPPAPAPPAPIGFVGAVPPSALISVPTLESANHQSFSSSDTISIDNDLSDIQAKLNDVKSNLKYILSRFAKTT